MPPEEPTPRVKICPALVVAVILVVAIVFGGPVHAAVKPMDDRELAAVRGADGSAVLPLPAAAGGNRLAAGLAAAFGSTHGATKLAAAEFAAAWQAAGLGALPAGYAGQPVSQWRVDEGPVTFSFGLDDVLGLIGLKPGMPSLGAFLLSNFDARGTTLWSWRH